MADVSGGKQLVRIEVIAGFVGVTVRRIHQLTQEGIIQSEPANDGNSGRMYDFLPTIKNLLIYYRDKADSRRSGDSEEMAEEKLRQIAAKRELDEIKLALAKGDSFNTDMAEKVWGSLVARLNVGLDSIPGGVAPMLIDRSDVNEITEIIQKRLNQAREEISRFNFEDFRKYGGAMYISQIEQAEIARDAADVANR